MPNPKPRTCGANCSYSRNIESRKGYVNCRIDLSSASGTSQGPFRRGSSCSYVEAILKFEKSERANASAQSSPKRTPREFVPDLDKDLHASMVSDWLYG